MSTDKTEEKLEEKVEEKAGEKLEEKSADPSSPQTEKENALEKEKAEGPEEKKTHDGGKAVLLRQVGIFCGLFAVCGLLLGVTDLLTGERIAENQGSRNMGFLEEVLPYGGNYREIHYSGSDPTVEAVYEAEEAGWVFQISPENSFSGTLTLMVGVNVDKTVSGVAVVDTGETEGLGLRASEPEFRDQFIGRSGTVRPEADGGTISAISGATVTTRAVCAAVNSALAAAGTLN